jgi:hypothetical protein
MGLNGGAVCALIKDTPTAKECAMSTDIDYFRKLISNGTEFQWDVCRTGSAWEVQAYHDDELAPVSLCTAQGEACVFATLEAVAELLKTLGVGRFSVNQYRDLPHVERPTSGAEQCIGT